MEIFPQQLLGGDFCAAVREVGGGGEDCIKVLVADDGAEGCTILNDGGGSIGGLSVEHEDVSKGGIR